MIEFFENIDDKEKLEKMKEYKGKIESLDVVLKGCTEPINFSNVKCFSLENDIMYILESKNTFYELHGVVSFCIEKSFSNVLFSEK